MRLPLLNLGTILPRTFVVIDAVATNTSKSGTILPRTFVVMDAVATTTYKSGTILPRPLQLLLTRLPLSQAHYIVNVIDFFSEAVSDVAHGRFICR
jgi:hypothetical protein